MEPAMPFFWRALLWDGSEIDGFNLEDGSLGPNNSGLLKHESTMKTLYIYSHKFPKVPVQKIECPEGCAPVMIWQGTVGMGGYVSRIQLFGYEHEGEKKVYRYIPEGLDWRHHVKQGESYDVHEFSFGGCMVADGS